MTTLDPRAAVDALAASRGPYLLGVRHHSPALAAVVPALLDEAGAEVVCVELPADFRPWLEHLADPETVAPVALAGAGEGGRLSFYPFADFSPELAAVRWARDRGAEVVCCDLPCPTPVGPCPARTGTAGWTTGSTAGRTATVPPRPPGRPRRAVPSPPRSPPPAPAGTARTCGTAPWRCWLPGAPRKRCAAPPWAWAGPCAPTPTSPPSTSPARPGCDG